LRIEPELISNSLLLEASGRKFDASVLNLLILGASLQTTVRVLVADDFAPWRRLLHSILQEKSELKVVCEVSDGLEAIQKARELEPDLILLDIGLPTLSGIEAARQIRTIVPKAKILFVSENYSIDIARSTLNAGGCGYVIKSDAGSELLAAIETVFLGKQFLSARLKAQNIRGVTSN
jgi:DNA-binding NarL/FixJ family response regulator